MMPRAWAKSRPPRSSEAGRNPSRNRGTGRLYHDVGTRRPMSLTPRLLRSCHGSRTRVALRYVLCAWFCSWTVAASAQDSAEAALPSERYLATVSAGIPLRLPQDEDFGQDTFAPVFTDALFGYVFAGEGTFRHGAGLGLSLNLTRDGGYSEPVYS